MSDATQLTLVVTRAELAAKEIMRLTLAAADGTALPAWEPGAHIDLHLTARGVDHVRQYSLCGSPADRHRWHVAVLRVPDGRGGSAYIHDSLAEGSSVRVSLPRNNFTFVRAERYLFVAGGIGITPMMPMVAAASAAGADWHLIYCGRSADTMAFIDEVLKFGDERVDLHAGDGRGRADLAALIAATPPDTEIYCCGPQPMIDAVDRACADRLDSLHVERFTRRQDASQWPDAAFEVEFARSGVVVTVPAERSILDVAEDEGIDIDSSCQEGVCGTCETRVLCGTPDHHDDVLTAAERAAGETIIVCVSRSASARLVLDA